EQGLDARRVGRDEVADLGPVRAVPRLYEGRRMAIVVGARGLEGAREAFEPERLESRVVEVEVLEPAPNVLAGHHLLAGDLLRLGYGFGDQHRIVDAAVVEDGPELGLRRVTLAAVDRVFLNVGEGRIGGSGSVPVELLEALGALAGPGRVRI